METRDSPATHSSQPDHGALEACLRRHQAGVWRHLRCRACQPVEADDLTQEALIAVLGHAALHFPVDQARAYLCTVARNALRRRRREQGREPLVDLDQARAVHDEVLADGSEAALRARP